MFVGLCSNIPPDVPLYVIHPPLSRLGTHPRAKMCCQLLTSLAVSPHSHLSPPSLTTIITSVPCWTPRVCVHVLRLGTSDVSPYPLSHWSCMFSPSLVLVIYVNVCTSSFLPV